MNFAIDSNIMVYAEGVNGAAGEAASRLLIHRLPEEQGLVPLQALGELYNVLTRKAGWSGERARDAVLSWRDTFTPMPTTDYALSKALDLATDHRLSVWDSVIVAVASENGCRLLISEDMQDGFTWGGVTVVNPFAVQPHRLLASLLADPGSNNEQ